MEAQLDEILPTLLENYRTARHGHYKRLLFQRPESYGISHADLYKKYADRADDFDVLKKLKHQDSIRIKATDPVVWKGEHKTQEYINKVVEKEVSELSSILKENVLKRMQKIIKGKQVVHSTANTIGKLSAHIDMLFEDNSSFTLQLQITWEYSNRGRMKHKFPLSFSTVVNSDGSKVPNASQTKMQKSFR